VTKRFDQQNPTGSDTPKQTDSVKNDLAKSSDVDVGSVDRQPFEAIYAEHIGFVWRCLRALGVATELLDDAAQEVFLTVHRRISGFRGRSSLRTWIYGIVRNVAGNYRRSQRRRGPHEALSPQLECAGASPLDRLQVGEAAAFIQNFLEGVSEGKRDVFVLACIEQMSMPEVANVLDVPLNTAYTRLRDVRSELQRALERKRGKP
jgi:RNA polymerase sigma-70 factor, ECF subfamily